MELVDTSVWARKDHPALREWFTSALIEGQIALTDMIALEILSGYGSRERFIVGARYLQAVPCVPMEAADWKRARGVYAELEEKHGTNIRRSVKVPDLFIAACAERHRLTIVHYDQDFETIAGVTGQPARWVAPRGTL